MYQKYKNVELVKPGGIELKDRLVGVQRVTKVTNRITSYNVCYTKLLRTLP